MELIRNARRSNFALVGLSAAVLALALAPLSTERIEAAIREVQLLNQLRSLDDETLRVTLDSVRSMHSVDLTLPRVQLRFSDVVDELNVENGGPLVLPPDLWVDVEAVTDWNDGTIVQFFLRDFPSARATVQNWLNYFDTPATYWFVPNKEVMQNAIRSAIPEDCNPCTLKRVLFEESEGTIYNAVLDFEVGGAISTVPIRFRGVIEEVSTQVLDTDPPLPALDDLRDLLRNTGEGRPFIPLIAHAESLRAIRGFHAQIADRKLDDAIAVLQAEAARTSPKLQVFGLSVDQRAAMLAAPGLVIALLLYILAHVRELSSALRERKELGWDASWIALFSNWIALVITVVSLCVFPVFACCVLLARVRWTVSTFYVAAAISLIIGAAVLGIWCVFALRAVRRRMSLSGPKT